MLYFNTLLLSTTLKSFMFVDDWTTVNNQRLFTINPQQVFSLVTQEFFTQSAKLGPRFLYSWTLNMILNMILNMLKCLVNQIVEMWLQWQS